MNSSDRMFWKQLAKELSEGAEKATLMIDEVKEKPSKEALGTASVVMQGLAKCIENAVEYVGAYNDDMEGGTE